MEENVRLTYRDILVSGSSMPYNSIKSDTTWTSHLIDNNNIFPVCSDLIVQSWARPIQNNTRLNETWQSKYIFLLLTKKFLVIINLESWCSGTVNQLTGCILGISVHYDWKISATKNQGWFLEDEYGCHFWGYRKCRLRKRHPFNKSKMGISVISNIIKVSSPRFLGIPIWHYFWNYWWRTCTFL